MKSALNIHIDDKIIEDDPQCYSVKDFIAYLIDVKMYLGCIYSDRLPKITDFWYDSTSNTLKADIMVATITLKKVKNEGDSNE